MACDEGLVDHIRDALQGQQGVGEKRMFGGVCFTFNGNMLCGVVGERLMARIGPAAYESSLKQQHVRPMDFTGKPMKGYIYVDSEGLAEDEDLHHWLEVSRAFVGNMPMKVKATKPVVKKAVKKPPTARR